MGLKSYKSFRELSVDERTHSLRWNLQKFKESCKCWSGCSKHHRLFEIVSQEYSKSSLQKLFTFIGKKWQCLCIQYV